MERSGKDLSEFQSIPVKPLLEAGNPDMPVIESNGRRIQRIGCSMLFDGSGLHVDGIGLDTGEFVRERPEIFYGFQKPEKPAGA